MLNWLLENWYYIIFIIAAVLGIVYGCMSGKAKEWLKFAVAEAEMYLGSGTGQLKLRQVYDWFTVQFPVFSKIVPFSIFSKWVDLALAWLREQLDSNENIKALIKGE